MDLGLLPLAFSLILLVSSRLLHPYSTDDKTSRLVGEKFSTVRDTQRGAQSFMGKRREEGEGDRDEQEEKRGRQKRRDHSSQ